MTTKNTKTTKKPVEKKSEIKHQIELKPVAKTTYHYWRNFVKYILEEGGVEGYRFVKDADSFNGQIMVMNSSFVEVKEVLAKYKKEHKDEVELWWN